MRWFFCLFKLAKSVPQRKLTYFRKMFFENKTSCNIQYKIHSYLQNQAKPSTIYCPLSNKILIFTRIFVLTEFTC